VTEHEASPGARAASVALADRPLLRGTLVATVLCALSAMAVAMSGEYHERKAARAAGAAGAGGEAMTAGRTDAAVSRLREAVALAPDRFDYRLALGQALLASGRATEAETYVRDGLREDPVHGPANLTLARIRLARGRDADAESAYYHAIYGRWSEGQEGDRLQARLELLDLLRRTASRDRIRAELNQLASSFPGDLTLQLSVARSLLDLHFPDAAARVYRTVIERFADPGSAYAGLAEAEFARADYEAAWSAARRAVDSDPDDRASAARRDLAAAVLALDPTRRRLSAVERVQRTARVLTLGVERLAQCRGSASADDDEQAFVRRTGSWTSLSRSRRLRQPDIGTEVMEELARRVRERCPPQTDPDALDLVFRQILGVPQG
jgi:predicted Zn-dependent protease